MSAKSATQRKNLISLAGTLSRRAEPLGIGLRQQCWAGVAITESMNRHTKATEFYGLSMREIIDAVKENNRTPAVLRNETMIVRTLEFAAR
jgi:hypothetical protein